jgi:protein-tyrosine phosphatase
MPAIDGPARRLHVPDCRNIRDLGGLPTSYGGRIRAGALIRSDSLAQLTPAGVAALRGRGVRRIVDLRSVEEAAEDPNPFADDPAYRLRPLIDPVDDFDVAWVATQTMSTIYRVSVDRNARFITAGLAAIADAPAGPVLVHCAAGKDRTGMTVALALSVAGVPVDVIAEDYAYTAECLKDIHDSRLAALTDPAARLDLEEKQSSRPQTIVDMLDHVRQRYGGVPAYLLAHGFTRSRLTALRARLLG